MRIAIVGSGVSGIFCAIELINQGFDGEIVMYDKGKSLDERRCFVTSDTPCKKCKICSITQGVGGAGSFSDSKLNFDPSGTIGGDMSELMTRDEIVEYLKKTYAIYQQFGIEEFQSKMYGLEHSKDALDIIDKIKDSERLSMVDAVTLHLGTENSRIIYGRMIKFLKEHGVDIREKVEVTKVQGNRINDEEFDKIVIAMGRSGNKLVKDICKDNNIKMKNGRVDIGVRVEVPNEVMQELNENFYECKIYFKGSFGDKARMFCTNPSGFVAVESYPFQGGKLFTANGHAYANKKSNNTNFAILVSRNFNEDCPHPLEDYVYPLIQATNSLGKGSVILQSLKDIKLNRRSTEERIAELDIVPTANVYKGDITSVMPYRTLVTILEFIEELNKIVPGIDGDNTLLYSPECKFHSNKVIIDKYGKSSNDDIYFIGDCSSYSRGLTTACSMGILCSEDILSNIK